MYQGVGDDVGKPYINTLEDLHIGGEEAVSFAYFGVLACKDSLMPLGELVMEAARESQLLMTFLLGGFFLPFFT